MVKFGTPCKIPPIFSQDKTVSLLLFSTDGLLKSPEVILRVAIKGHSHAV